MTGVAQRAARHRHPQPLTGVRREASKPRERPTGPRSARDARKTPPQVDARRFGEPLPAARAAPPEAHESLIGRKTAAEAPLTGLSF
jgi:hypothetical protein